VPEPQRPEEHQQLTRATCRLKLESTASGGRDREHHGIRWPESSPYLGCPAKHAGARTRVQVILERLQFAEDSGNQFRHRRMNVHGPLHHCVRGTRIHRV
jgi:hypothetical protein